MVNYTYGAVHCTLIVDAIRPAKDLVVDAIVPGEDTCTNE